MANFNAPPLFELANIVAESLGAQNSPQPYFAYPVNKDNFFILGNNKESVVYVGHLVSEKPEFQLLSYVPNDDQVGAVPFLTSNLTPVVSVFHQAICEGSYFYFVGYRINLTA